MGKFLEYVNKSKKEEDEEKKSSSATPQIGNFGRYAIGKTLGLDTLGTDLTSVGTNLTKAFTEWQTPETMKNTRASVESVYNRLLGYQDYQKKYGDGSIDLTDVVGTYKYALDNWDDIEYTYSGYKDADAWKKAMGESEAMKTADLGVIQKEITDLEGIYSKAKEYSGKAKSVTQRASNFQNRSGGAKSAGGYADDIRSAEKEYNDYLASVGYGSVEEIEKTLGEKKVYHTNASRMQNLIKMSSVGDVNSENYDKDYNKYVESGKSIPADEIGTSKRMNPQGKGRVANTPIVNSDLREAVLAAERRKNGETSVNADKHYDKAAIYDNMTDDEFNNLYYYIGKDKEDGGNRAEEYLESIKDSLNSRRGKEIAQMVKDTPWGEFGFSIEAGLDQWSEGVKANFSDEDYIPYSPVQQASGRVRQNISEEYGSFATGAYDFGVTGANMLPSILAGTAVSMIAPQVGVTATMSKVVNGLSKAASSASMFASARGNAYQEMLNLGYSKEQASTYGNIVGASEVGLQSLLGGISKLGTSVTSKGIAKLVSSIDNGFARFAIQYGSSMASEGIEEGLQEILNPMFKNIAAGYDTGAKIDWGEVAYSTLLGGLLGGAFEAGPLASQVSRETRFNNAVGKNIKANERVGDLFNFASQTSEESEAYKTYTQYANKGINAENVSDYKLGNLYSQTRAEAEGIANSKKSTAEQKAQAEDIIKELDVYSQASPSARTGSAKNFDKKAVKNIYDKETVNALIESGLESAEGTESHKLAVKYMEKMGLTEAEVTAIHTKILEGESLTKEESSKLEGMKNLSVDEITKLSDANDAAIRAEENASAVEELVERGESKDVAELVARKIRGEILTTEEATKVAESDVALQYVAEQSNAENVTEELLEKAKAMPKKDAALFVALYDGKTDMEAYANAFNLAVMKSENNFSQDDIFKSKSVLSNAQVSKIFEEVRIKADKDVEAKFNNLIKATADKKFYKGSIDESVIDYDNKSASASGKVNWKDLDSRQKKAITFMNGFARATGINLVWTKDDEKANGKYDRASNTLYLDVYAGIDHADKLADTIIPTASHELTHWMEKKSPEFFRKINDLVFSTLYEHDGRTEEKRIKDEMARTGKSEAVVRSEIIARACEEVLSLSEQGKKIFNSLSKSEQKTFVDKIKEIIQDIVDWVSEFLGLYGKDSLHYEARVLHQYQDKLAEIVKLWDEALVRSVEVNQALENSGLYGHVDSIGSIDLKALAKAVGINGESLFQYKAMVEDEAIYREMLLKHKDTIGITKADINALFDMIDKAVDIISENVEALDYAWDADIDDRAFNPVKPNSDKLYKVSLDFSTLCRKRLLQQTVQQTLQNVLNKQLSKEESIAIRDELMKVQEEGRKIEVACALCYVEAARMKSPEQIKKFLDNREASIREFFANRNGGDIKTKVAEAEMKAREKLKADNPDGYFGKNDEKLDVLIAPKSRMLGADAKFVRAEGKKAKTSYELTEHEQAELDAALKMKVTDFTSAKGLESLAKNHPDLFDAFTSFVRNATHSKGIESDVWWRAGDSDSIGDSLIAKMNEENGLRSQSWSDFQVIHLLDYIAATIELSTKGAKRQSYTKVPDYVKLLGNTGDMINLSLIPERVFDGKLKYDAVEGMAYEIAKKLRDEYHATVGTVCIGINDEQIKMLLMDEFIDYVIPYHHSSMSKATRKLMHIPAWESYQDYQNEKNLSDADALARAKKYGVTLNKGDAKYQKSPNFSEWFDIEEARQIAKMENEHPSDAEEYKKYGKMYGGYKAMQNAANNYLRLCAERGLAPKFSMATDFTQEANYWKLLIDRKMVDNVTGEIIEQMPIKPIFNEKHVLEILTDELERYPQVKADQEYAVRKVTEKFLSGEMKVDASTLEAIKKPIDNVTEVNILESSRDDVLYSEKVMDITEEDYKNMAKHFGVTGNFNVAGYLLGSGKMLDFSGKHWGDTTSTYRQVDHRDIQEALPDDNNGRTSMMSMISNGNIRLMPEIGGINLAIAPTKNQRVILRRYIGYMSPREGIIVDIDKVGGDTIKSFTYDKGTSADRIMRDIDNYFKGGTQSELMRFHTAEGDDVLYSERVKDEDTLDFLNNQKTLKVYRAMQVIDGKLYPPMAARVKNADGKKELVYSSEIGVWEQATEHPELIKKGKFELDKANGSSINAAYNPYIHTSASPLNDQFSSAYKRDNLVTVEGEIPISELTSGYRAEFAKDSVGETKWHSGPVASKLKGDKARKVYLSRWFKPIRIVPDSEVAMVVAKTLEGEDVKIPYKVVTPSLREALEKQGVPILHDYSYDELVSKKPMEVKTLQLVTPSEESKYKADYDLFAKDMRDIAASVGNAKNTKTSTYLYCNDLGNDVQITRWSFKHGAARLDNAYISICKSLADVLSTSVVVNELSAREDTNGAYVLLGLAENTDSYVIVRSVVNKKTWKLEDYNELYAIKKASIKKGDVGLKAPALHLISGYGTSPKISIANFLDFVNSQALGGSVLSLDVLKHLNSTRTFDQNVTPDILFSERDDVSVYDLMGEKERLQKQNKEFKAELERLRERVSIERKVTNNTYIDNNKALVAAGHIRNIANSTYDKVRLAKEIQGIYSYIGDADSKSEALFRKAYEIADNVLREAKEEKVVDDYFKGVLKDIRATRISLDDMQKQEARHLFGDHYNRNFIGRVIIAEDGISLDSKWKEWAEKYPDQFDADVNPNDQIGELYDIINTLQEASETVIEYDAEERKRWLTYELLNTFWNLPTVETVADKYEKRIKQIRAEHREAMTKVRNEYKDRLGKQRMADDIHYGRKISDLKKSSEEALAEQKKADRERFKQIYANIRERKDTEIALAKAHGREMLSSYKERAEMKTHIQSITSNALTLNEWLVKNSKEKHIHESLKGPVTNLLNAINFSSKSLLEKGKATKKDVSLQMALSQVSTMMTKASNGQEELVELYGHGLTDEIEKMMASVEDITDNLGDNEFVLQMMSLTDLQTLDKMVKSIKQAVTKMNKFHTVNHAMGIANLSQNSMVYLDSLGKGNVYDGMRGKASKLLNWGNALPYYVFKRYGEGGMKVYEALQDGWDKFSFNTKAIIDYSEDVYTSKEVKEWSEEIRTFKILVPASEIEMESENYTPKYQEVKLTVPQIMSMYCLNKREQARGHLFRGGIRVADFKDAKGNIVSQSEGVIFTEKDVQSIFNTLTDRQKKVADKLQEFMNTVCTDWGNEVSMARFGYKAFGEENYFPIQSDKNNLAVNDETEQVNSLFKLLNMSFTKGVIEKANNRIVISDIFDVFAQHTSDMAKYNALALPVLDAFKWYNYTEKQDVAEGTFKTTGVKQSIENAFGKDGQNYFTTFLKDINGQQEVSRDTLGGGFFKNAKISAVGLNLRVVLLQPTSYVRASAIIDNKYLTKAFGHTPKIKKAEQYCGIALWKSMGYYDTNVQKGVEAQIKHNDTWKDKATEISMKGAEWADKVTWGYLWNACELEVRDKRKDLKVGSEEFYDAISKRLREVIYATQVVDSTMTRSQMMRSTDRMDKMLTAFASEPTLSYNMLQDAYVEYNLDVRRMGKKEAIKKNAGKVARVVTAYTITNALAALVESAFDAFRDDDDEEKDLLTFMRKYYLSNFLSDMSIVNKIPYIKELYSFIQGFGSSRTDTQWMEYMSKAFTTWYKIATTGKGKPAAAVKYSLKAISDISGLPFYNLYRDLMSGLDKLHLFSADELNEMFGDFLD